MTDGWTNGETKALWVWLSNDQRIYTRAIEAMALSAPHEAHALENFVRDELLNPELPSASWDLITMALRYVKWSELVNSMKS